MIPTPDAASGLLKATRRNSGGGSVWTRKLVFRHSYLSSRIRTPRLRRSPAQGARAPRQAFHPLLERRGIAIQQERARGSTGEPDHRPYTSRPDPRAFAPLLRTV